jgi:hypothetical protein
MVDPVNSLQFERQPDVRRQPKRPIGKSVAVPSPQAARRSGPLDRRGPGAPERCPPEVSDGD